MSLGSGSRLASSASPPARLDDGRQCVLHEVTRFDTLAGIAIRYGAEVADIKKANRISTDSQMFAMRLIRVPLSPDLSASPPLLSPTACHRASSSQAVSSHQGTDHQDAGGTSPASSATLTAASSSLATPSAANASGSASGAGSLSEAILELVSAQAAAEQAEAQSRSVAAAEAAGRARASTFFFVQMREAEQYVSSEGEEPSPPCQRGTSLSEGEGDEGGRRLSWLGGGPSAFYSEAKGRGAGRSTWNGEARQPNAQEYGWGLGVEEGGGGTSSWRGGYGSEGEGGWASGEEEVGGRGGGGSRRRWVEQAPRGRGAGRDEGLGVWGLMSSGQGLMSSGQGLMSSGQGLFSRGVRGQHGRAVNLGAAARWGSRVVEDLLWRFHKSTSFSTFEGANGPLNSSSAAAAAGGPARSPLRREPSSSSTGIDLPSARSWIRPSSAAGAVEGGSSDASVLLGCSTPIKGGEGGACDDGSATALGGAAVYGSVTRRGVSSRRGKGVPTDITG
ncbi:hypothetical protein CLOP_g6134 [Closterium sp. NIES-67]|nr:hypothetical protein CLOP_g6134 [Closterium sp. NIES-67]